MPMRRSQPGEAGDQYQLRDHDQGGVEAEELADPDERVLRRRTRDEYQLATIATLTSTTARNTTRPATARPPDGAQPRGLAAWA